MSRKTPEQLLSPYLGYDLLIETRYANMPNAKDRGILVGIDRTTNPTAFKVKVADNASMYLTGEECMPVMRPLEHLAETVDGKIPGIEVAKMIWGQPITAQDKSPVSLLRYPKINWRKVQIDFCSDGTYDVYQLVLDEHYPPSKRRDILVSFYRDGRIQPSKGLPLSSVVFDYLRSLHFALDTPTNQFISK